MTVPASGPADADRPRDPATAWFPWRKTRPGARLRLICLPHAGGSALAYRGWAAALPGDVELAAAEPPGRGLRLREPPVSDMAALVEALAAAIDALPPLPVVLYGHSLGAYTAVALARRRAATGRSQPRALLLSGAGPLPDLPERQGRNLHRLPDDALSARLAAFAGTPRDLLDDAAFRALMLPPIRADLRLFETWRPRPDAPPLAMPFHLYGGDADPEAPADRLAAWRAATRAAATVTVFSGGHFFHQHNQGAFLRILAADLGRYRDG